MEFYLKALLWLVIGAFLGFAIYFIFFPPAQPPLPINTQPQNDTMPPVLETGTVNLTMVDAPDCDICNAEGLLLEQTKTVLLKSEFLSVGTAKRLPASSSEAQALISRYNLTTLPAVIIEGDVGRDMDFVNAWKANIGTLEGANALVTRIDYPPYYDIGNGTVVGLVEGIGIKASGCLECGDPGLFMSSLEGPPISMVFTNSTVYEENDSEAQALIAEFNITKLPALFLRDSGISAYPVYKQIRPLGTVENGWFVLRDVVPPYMDLADNRSIRGLVKVTYLVNSSCVDCFDITSLSDYLSSTSGVDIVENKTFEVNSAEGMALIEKYSITKIPTLILSPDARYYYHFEDAWKNQSNTVEPDGSFVFRAHGLLGSVGYQNISG